MKIFSIYNCSSGEIHMKTFSIYDNFSLLIFFFRDSYQSPSDGKFRDPLMCSNTVLKSVSPYLCHRHAQDMKKQISLSLKKSGASVSLSTKIASKFHFHHVINEYVNHIQSGRRAAAKDLIGIANGNNSS